MGGHSSRDDTTAKLQRFCWWPHLYQDVKSWVKNCAVCRLSKPMKGISIEQRTMLYDRPFRVLLIDAMGPIEPPGENGEQYIIHCQCPFSGWPWLKAVKSDDGLTTAKFLVEDVFFDVAGFPTVLRSDRGSSYTSNIVAEVNKILGVQQSFTTAYHPESLGYLEASHLRVNHILASYCRKFPKLWPRYVKLAQWAMRATPRADRQKKSPYELVVGMVPQGPIDKIFARLDNF